MKTYYVYIITNKRNGTLYIGFTNNLLRRIWEHKQGKVKGFASKYHLNKLVWYDHTNLVHEAIKREKQLKEWKRDWKINLIENTNPDWNDLSIDWFKDGFAAFPTIDNWI